MPFFLRYKHQTPFAYTYRRLALYVLTDGRRKGVFKGREWHRLLADEEHVYGAEIKVIIERQGGEAIVCRVLASVKLGRADAY
jgi:hypothetical protein